jgi:hypothetical protein
MRSSLGNEGINEVNIFAEVARLFRRLNSAPYFDLLIGCLAFFAFRSFACLTSFCFLSFSLSFLPPLSPIVCLLWLTVHFPAFREPLFLTMNAIRSTSRWQGRDSPSADLGKPRFSGTPSNGFLPPASIRKPGMHIVNYPGRTAEVCPQPFPQAYILRFPGHPGPQT